MEGSKFSLDVVFERFGFAIKCLSVRESIEQSNDVIHLVTETSLFYDETSDIMFQTRR